MAAVRTLLVILALAHATFSSAQDITLDSLREIWSDTTQPSRQRVPALAYVLDHDRMFTVRQAVVLAVGDPMDTVCNAFRYQLALATLARSSTLSHQGQYTGAVAAATEAQVALQQWGTMPDVALAHAYLGRHFSAAGMQGEAAKHQLIALSGYEQAQDTLGQVTINNELAFSYGTQGINDKALTHYQRMLALIRHRFPQQTVDVMLRISDLYKDMDDRTKALAWLDTATYVVQHEGGTDPERLINWTRGNMIMDQGDYAGALAEFRLALIAIDAEPGNPAGKSWIRSQIALAHAYSKDYRSAVQWASAGLAMAEAHHLQKEALDNLFPLATAYEGLGNTREGLRYYKRYQALKDSVSNTETARSLSDATMTFDFAKQQLADSLIAAQHQHEAKVTIARERTRRNILFGMALFALAMGTINYRQRRRTQRALHRSDELLLNILPSEVAEELKTKGAADAKQFDQVTILFTDFKGFTAMSEVLTPQQLVRDLNECFSAFDRICEKHGIEKIKTIGDAYMAAGGLPTPNSTHAVDAVKAALEMRDFIQAGKARKVAAGLPFFEIRIGVHTGPVVAGIVGVKKFQYDIWGDTVNTASRMESSGEVGQVNISEATYALVKDTVVSARLSVGSARVGSPAIGNKQLTSPAFTFTPRGKIQAKGKGELEMYYVALRQ